ncbi:hypothetical protein [Thermomonospora curvata]|uniref:DUF7919 domain-containing protein n=1 Tax=Thermomonospora curvata (strain ATCC 19995 / DSM 43183 / JCM 3096 / KCTC 9072 / NBRC 15933 / NCIMB 10081 / Henssen B9) TaxID=471852 RepID=D1ABV6_THECD|nr:hypothetical protein [Thermomonospora curvata]ACY99129.1 hypothetical protein Tcur_3595 [Thermomonospora curvata DSM 43183]
MECTDLSLYVYREFLIPMRSIGWLGREHGIPGAGMASLGSADLSRLKSASWILSTLTLGWHDCEFCDGEEGFEGNGEYHYYFQDGSTYSAPMMILHYVEEHGYRPPEDFLERLRKAGPLEWDWRAERLSEVLLDETEDLERRCGVIVDLANWREPRTLDVLWRAAQDEELVDVGGVEIGRSLGVLLSCDFAKGIDVSSFPETIEYGIELTSQGVTVPEWFGDC